MNEKNIDELLYRTGEAMDMDELTKPCEYHKFSDDYQERMNRLRQNVMENADETETKGHHSSTDTQGKAHRQSQSRSGAYGSGSRRNTSRKRKFPGYHWGTVAAAILLVSVISLGVYAYFNSIHADVSQNKDNVTVNIKGVMEDSSNNAGEDASVSGNDTGNADGSDPSGAVGNNAMSVDQVLEDLPDEGIKVPVVTITLGYLPEGYEEIEGLNRHYSIGGEYAGSGFWVNQNWSREWNYQFVSSYEQRKIGDMEAIILIPKITDAPSTYHCDILLINPIDNVSIYLGSDTPEIGVDELTKIAENLTYEPKGTFENAYYISIEEFTGPEPDRSLSPDQIVETFTLDNTYTGSTGKVKLVDVTFADDVSNLDKNNFYDPESLNNYLTDQGTIKDERLRYVEDENGADVRRESADAKLMLVTLEISNTGNENIVDFSTSSSFDWYQFSDEGTKLQRLDREIFYDEYQGGDWCYLDGSKYTIPGEDRIHSFFCIDIPRGEKRTITLGRMIYTDEIETSYLCYSPNGSLPMEKPYSEERQLIYIGDRK